MNEMVTNTHASLYGTLIITRCYTPHGSLQGVNTNDMCGSMQLCNCSIKKNKCSCFNAKPKRKCLCSIAKNKNYLIEYLFGGF
jgi:hypothetical protein